MAVPNLIALLALSPVVVKLTREHLAAALGKD
jgi:Na+/alanine symporter